MKEFNLLLTLLRKFTQGKTNIFATLKELHESGCILKDVMLISDEMYIKKFEEFVGSEVLGASGN